ncbi:MAG: hypothetical protein A3J24_00765 [Deltaproteobacteria bacterium RIFCSPLOWO2_02_FULL_53_8]|nr:MAG: hypothetical protein A3J24_00765 [Deltaproteobacteria bacterium RIFCSPLOWO2_02_FULL_53_8]
MSEHLGGHTEGGELVWHTSVWPALASFGLLLLLPLPFMLHFVYSRPLTAAVVLLAGVVLVILSVAGWVKEGLEDVHGYGAGHSVWAMPLFIVAEAMIFVGFLAAYWILRFSAASWPPAGTPVKEYFVPVFMTFLLVSSSVTIHFAEKNLELERESMPDFIFWLCATIILGAVFSGLTVYEWSSLFHEGFNLGTNVYSTAFYSITGLHASHVFAGLGIFVCILIPALRGKVNIPFVKAASMYWHFVDLVWLFVVTQVYFW